MSVFVAVRVRPLSQPSATQRPSLHLQLQEPDHNDGASSSLYAVDLISATTVTFTPEAIEASEHSRWARAAEVRGLTPPATARQGSTPRAGGAPPPPLLSSSGVALPRRHHDTPAFDFDVCFSSEPRHPNYATQADVYDCVGVPILDAFLRGLNGCILAYGQTGSGKTYSMLGPYGEELNRVQHTRAVNTQRELLVQPQRPPRAPSLPGGAVPSLGRAAVAPSLDNSFVGSDFSTAAARGAVGGVGAVHLQRLFHDPERGIMLRLVDDLFARLSLLEEEAMRDRRMCRLDLQVTYYQVYREKVYCLLQPRADRRAAPLRVREDHRGAYIEGLTQHNVRCVEDVLALLELGTMHRRVATTTKNDVSSRSHAVFTVRLRRVGDSEDSSFVSTLHLVDLAGSERTGTQTSSTPTDSQGAGSGTFGPKATAAAASHIGETSDINAALSCLGRVIHVLAQNSINATAAQQSQSPTRRSTARSMTPPASSRGGPQHSRSSAGGRRQSPAPSHRDLPNASAAVVKPLHVPYRESTLTFLLKDCLGGNARTAMLSTISPSFADLGETLSTLRYASRARRIINHPIANTDARSAEVAATLRAEIRELQAQLRDAANDAQLRELQEQLQFREQGMQDYEDRLREAEAQRSEWEIERAELLEKVIVVTQERSYMESLLQSSQEANRMLKRRLESVGQTVEDVEVAMQFAGGALTSSSAQADDEKDDHINRDRPIMGASRNVARESQPTQQQDGNEESEGGRREDSPVVLGAGGVLSSRGDSERTSQTASTTTQQQQSQIAQPTTVTIAPMNWREERKNDGAAVGAVSGAPEGRRSPAIIFGRKPSLPPPPPPATTASADLLEHDEERVDNKLLQHPSSSSFDEKKQRQVDKQQPDLQSKSPPPSSSSPLQNRWQLPERYRWMLQQASEDHHDEHDDDEDEEALASSARAMVLTQPGSSAAVRMPPSTRTAPKNAASTTQPPTRNKHNTAAAAGPAVPHAATSLDPPVDIDPPPLCDRTQEPASPSSTDERRRNPSSRRYRMGGDGEEEVDEGEEEDRLDRLDNASLLDEAKRIGIDIDSLLQNVKKQKKKHHHSHKHEKKETALSSPSQPPTWNTSPKHHQRPTNGSATAAEKPPIGKSAAAPSASPPRPFSSRPTAIGVPSALPPSPSSKTTSAASLLFHPNQKSPAPSAAVAVKPLPPPPFAVPPPLQKVSSSLLSATTNTQTPTSHRGTTRPQPQLADRSGEVILRESQQQQPLGATVPLPQRGSSSSDVVAVNPNTPRTNRRPVAAEGPPPPPPAATPVGSHNNNSGSSGSSSNAAVERYRQLLRDQTAPKLRH